LTLAVTAPFIYTGRTLAPVRLSPLTVIDALFGGGCGIAGHIKPGNRISPLMDYPAACVRQQANRGPAGWVQFDAVEGRLFNRSKTVVSTPPRCR